MSERLSWAVEFLIEIGPWQFWGGCRETRSNTFLLPTSPTQATPHRSRNFYRLGSTTSPSHSDPVRCSTRPAAWVEERSNRSLCLGSRRMYSPFWQRSGSLEGAPSSPNLNPSCPPPSQSAREIPPTRSRQAAPSTSPPRRENWWASPPRSGMQFSSPERRNKVVLLASGL